MTLHELIESLDKDAEVGIWDIRNPLSKHKSKYEKSPTRQTYCKVKNLKFGDIKDLLKLDVLCINIYKDGLLIRLYDKVKTENDLKQHSFIYKLANQFK